MDARIGFHAEGTLDEGEGDECEEHCVGTVEGCFCVGEGVARAECSMIGGGEAWWAQG